MKASTFPTGLSTLVTAIALSVGLAGCSSPPAAYETSSPSTAWKLDNETSDLRFVTTKNTNAAEVQQFKKLSGELKAEGTVSLDIDLSSVETQIPIRNERMRTMLFEVTQYPTAHFEGAVDMARINGIEVGGSLDVDVAGKLDLHGKSQDAHAALRVVRLRENRLMVTTRAPVLVNAAKFELSPGLEKLREIMGLPNIIGTVPVNFSLVFQKQRSGAVPSSAID